MPERLTMEFKVEGHFRSFDLKCTWKFGWTFPLTILCVLSCINVRKVIYLMYKGNFIFGILPDSAFLPLADF